MNLHKTCRATAFTLLVAMTIGGITACNRQPEKVCNECGTVNAVYQVKDEGKATGAGAVTGAVVGGVLGHQTGKGRGKDAMTVLGAVGGAVAGNYAEKQMRTTYHWEVTARFNDGSTRTFTFASKPGFAPGDAVKSSGGTLVAMATQ